MTARYWIAAVVLAAAALAAGLWYQQSAPEPAPLIAATEPATADGTITVHVSGEVMAPGLVELVEGARVADAVAGAGGTTRAADLGRVNLAAGVTDGLQIVIPSENEPGEGAAPDDGRVRVNTATVVELEALPGVGPVLAERIAAYREESGGFAVVEDLLDVPGIGEAKLDALRDSVAIP